MPWYVLYTKPRAEQKVASSLKKMGVEVYCPLITEVRQWSDRKKKVQIPLFTSYIFVNLTESERQSVFDVPGSVRYLFWLGKPAIVKDAEIETIQNWLNGDNVEEVKLNNLTPGDAIIISNGAFKNQEAIIKKVGKQRMSLVLPALGCTVNIKIAEAL